jgi:hypothetical protein
LQAQTCKARIQIFKITIFLAQVLGAFVELCVEVGVESGGDLGEEILIKNFAILGL